MGLDGVELLMAVEERFGISVETGEAGRLRTVGDLRDLIQRRLPSREGKRCLTAHAFLRLRRALGELTGVSRSAISPATPLAGVLPAAGRRQAWRRLERSVGCRLPELRLPAALERGLVVAFLLVVPLAIMGGSLGLLPSPIAWALGLGAFPALVAALYVTRPLATSLPAECETAGRAARAMLALNFAEMARQVGCSSDREVWSALRETVVERLGVEPGEVTPEARFREDLGVD